MDNLRIKKITIHDFKGFRSDTVQAIDLKGKNLLLYGENGSGKTTIFTALKELLSRAPTREFDNDFRKASCLKNRLSSINSEDGKVRLEFEATDGRPVKEPPMEWRINAARPTDHAYFLPMSLSSGFLDYRAILLTHFLDYDNDQINLFKLVVETLLRDVQMPSSAENTQIPLLPPISFGSEWKGIQERRDKVAIILNTDSAKIDTTNPDYLRLVSELGFDAQDYADEDYDEEEDAPEINVLDSFVRFRNSEHEELKDQIEEFASDLKRQLSKVEEVANQYLKTFDPWLEIAFDRVNITIPTDKAEIASADWMSKVQLPLRAKFRGRIIEHPGTVLNEARLTALALTIYLAALKVQASAKARVSTQQNAPHLLVLDDVLIGFDMAHRRPVLDLLKSQFPKKEGWQVMLFTYDRAWYEVAKQRLGNNWQFYEMYSVQVGDYEQPLIKTDDDSLYRALGFLDAGEVKAAAVHVRSKFELVVKNACEKFGVPMRYTATFEKVAISVYWNALKAYHWERKQPAVFGNSKGRSYTQPEKIIKVQIVSNNLAAKIDLAVTWVLNPLSHSEIIESYISEIKAAIFAIDDLETRINLINNQELVNEQCALIATLTNICEARQSVSANPMDPL